MTTELDDYAKTCIRFHRDQFPNLDTERIRWWAEALESGEYSQTTGELHNATECAFCCLGVGCRVGIEHGLELSFDEDEVMLGPGPDDLRFDHLRGLYDGSQGVLPSQLARWFGLVMLGDDESYEELIDDPSVWHDGAFRTLTDLNDSELADFDEIAKAIRLTYLDPL